MTKRIAFINWHSISEYDHLKILSEIGYEVVSLGAYLIPSAPGDDKRPALYGVPAVLELLDILRDTDAAKKDIPDALLEWLGDDGIIIQEHYFHHLYNQWFKLADWKRGAPGRRIIRRTCGQTDAANEETAAYYQKQGLERVAYSPKEANLPGFAGQDALIRFYADPEVWTGWTGTDPRALNVTQDLLRRHQACNAGFVMAATQGVPRLLMGEGSQAAGGTGNVSFEDMQTALRECRAYIYSGTQPASYTLGLIEAMMTGTPVVSIGPSWMTTFRYGPDLFEGHELAWKWSESPQEAQTFLLDLLNDPDLAAEASKWQRAKALEVFDKATVAAQWKAFLG